jgi:cellobiose epimerase
VSTLQARIEHELGSNILPFWLRYGVDPEFGGFRGQISNDLTIDPHADKGLILNTRILWTFARVYEVYREETILIAARRAYEYIVQHFRDEEYGGFYWMVDYKGDPTDTRKRIYGQAFAVYALAEYYRVTGQRRALDIAIETHKIIEKVSYDSVNQGYFETYERNWMLAIDQRLSEVDMDEKKSMNTHLHVLEAYATLLGEWENETLRQRLRELIALFRQRIINPANHHLLMFFNEKWQPQSDHISYGHDIEASWLLVEVLGDEPLIGEMREESVRMAQAIHDEAVDIDGGLLYEADSHGLIDSDKHWWPQAEAVVGFLSAYQISHQKHFLDAAVKSWAFIENCIVDHTNGEWFWKVSRDGVVSEDKYKVDPWKCPYHNTRACLEALNRLGELNKFARELNILEEN